AVLPDAAVDEIDLPQRVRRHLELEGVRQRHLLAGRDSVLRSQRAVGVAADLAAAEQELHVLARGLALLVLDLVGPSPFLADRLRLLERRGAGKVVERDRVDLELLDLPLPLDQLDLSRSRQGSL